MAGLTKSRVTNQQTLQTVTIDQNSFSLVAGVTFTNYVILGKFDFWSIVVERAIWGSCSAYIMDCGSPELSDAYEFEKMIFHRKKRLS
jgi:hypothetical protein